MDNDSLVIDDEIIDDNSETLETPKDNYLNHNINLKNLDNSLDNIENSNSNNISDDEDEVIDIIDDNSKFNDNDEIIENNENNENNSNVENTENNEDNNTIENNEDNVNSNNNENNNYNEDNEYTKIDEKKVTYNLDNNNNNVEESWNILNQYGENFSTKEYVTNPAIGRDDEIKQLIVTLLTPEKSAILVGKPGIGKTAIVEGLGYRIKKDEVPNALKGYTIFKLNTASLTGVIPETNELRIQYIVDHIKNLDKIMIFIDEIHTLIGNGENTLDFANIIKPLIDRGTIKVIGATTSDEYNRYVLRDKAFVRRFQRIDVSEPTREMVIQIMMGTYPKFEKKMGLKLKYTDFIKENIMAFITDATTEYKRVYETSIRYPDIALTILQQAFSYASFDNRQEVTIRDIRKAIQTTKLIYPDVIKKELEKFNVTFKDVYLMETKQILKDEV